MRAIETPARCKVFWTALLLALSLTWSRGFGAPSVVTVSGTSLEVQKRLPSGGLGLPSPYTIRGVCYSPASITTATTQSDPNNANIRRNEFGKWFLTDIPLLKAMNVNTVRLFIDPGVSGQVRTTGLAMLDEFWRNDIMVIMTIDDGINNTNRIVSAVNLYKDHPAILFWSLGSEWNIFLYFGVAQSVMDAAQRTEQAARLVKTLDSAHPVAASYGEIDIQKPGLRLADTKNYVNNVCPSVSIWSLNVYRGRSFGSLFNQWASISSKPFFFGEFGIDAFHATARQNPNPPGTANENEQADWVLNLWTEIVRNSSEGNSTNVCIGGAVFEFIDEWWKFSTPEGANAFAHDTGGWFPGGFPDGMGNEEFFGIYTIQRAPRKLASVLTTAFGPFVLVDPDYRNGQFSVSFSSLPGKRYELQSSEDIGRGVWATVARVTAPGGRITLTDTNRFGDQRFFRVKM